MKKYHLKGVRNTEELLAFVQAGNENQLTLSGLGVI